MFETLFKNIVFFLVFWLNSGVKEDICGQNSKMGAILTIQGQTVKVPFSKPWEVQHVQVLSYFSTCSFLKSGKPTPIKIIFLKLTTTDLLLHKV